MSSPAIPAPPLDASASVRGVVNLGAQTFAGDKTFTGAVVAAGLTAPSLQSAAGNLTLNAASGITNIQSTLQVSAAGGANFGVFLTGPNSNTIAIESALGYGNGFLFNNNLKTNSAFISGASSGQNGFQLRTPGARLKLSDAGTTDYFTSDGSGTITAAGNFVVGSGITLNGSSGGANFGGTIQRGAFTLGDGLLTASNKPGYFYAAGSSGVTETNRLVSQRADSGLKCVVVGTESGSPNAAAVLFQVAYGITTASNDAGNGTALFKVFGDGSITAFGAMAFPNDTGPAWGTAGVYGDATGVYIRNGGSSTGSIRPASPGGGSLGTAAARWGNTYGAAADFSGVLTVGASGIISSGTNTFSGATPLNLTHTAPSVFFNGQTSAAQLTGNISAANAGATPASAMLAVFPSNALDAADWVFCIGNAANAARLFNVTYAGDASLAKDLTIGATSSGTITGGQSGGNAVLTLDGTIGSQMAYGGSLVRCDATRPSVNMGGASAATQRAAIGGLAFISTTAVGNVGAAGPDNLISYTLPAAALSANGQGLRIKAWGSFPNNANAKTVAIVVGGTTVETKQLTANAAGTWEAEVIFVRTGSNTQDFKATMINDIGTTLAAADGPTVQRQATFGTATETDTNTIVIKGQATASTADNDVVQEGMAIWHFNQ